MNTKQIKTINIEKLFGIYDYSLKIPLDVKDNVFIIYGDNGTGKSTVLKLVYHMLSSESGGGHKTFLANIVFKKFEVVFDDNTIVCAERKTHGDDLKGNYCLSFWNDIEKESCEIPCVWDDESHRYIVKFMSFSAERRKSYTRLISKLRDIRVFYISDRRNEERYESSDIRQRGKSSIDDPVESEMIQLHEWIISQALEASKKGEEGTTEIYVKILTKLSGVQDNKEPLMMLEDIANEIKTLDMRAKSYAQMGFISNADYSEVHSKLLKVKKSNREAASNIIMPFLEIQKKRLDSLDNLFDTIAFYNNSLNDYFYQKRVVYSIQKGFRFYQKKIDDAQVSMNYLDQKDEIDVKKLSSGERQLLKLFSMVIRKSNECPIIIIDEPEISLNIKWQRRLLSTLQFFVRNTRAQFVVATHSFEILSSHLKNTVKIGDSYLPVSND